MLICAALLVRLAWRRIGVMLGQLDEAHTEIQRLDARVLELESAERRRQYAAEWDEAIEWIDSREVSSHR